MKDLERRIFIASNLDKRKLTKEILKDYCIDNGHSFFTLSQSLGFYGEYIEDVFENNKKWKMKERFMTLFASFLFQDAYVKNANFNALEKAIK